MEFTIDRASLVDELGRAQSLVESKVPIPSLSCVLMEPSSFSTVKFTTTNVNNTLVSEVEAEVIQGNKLCLGAHSLYEAARLMPDGPVHLTSEDNHWVTVVGGETKMRLPGINPDEFVATPKIGDLKWMGIPSADMSRVIHLTEYAMAKGEMSSHVYGAGKLEIEDGEIRMICSDGRRFSLATSLTSVLTFDDIEVLIPARSIEELRKLITAGSGELGLAQSDNHIFFRLGHRVLIAVKLAGQFPDYRRVFSSINYVDGLTLGASEFSQSVKRAALISDEVIEVDFQKGSIQFSARSAKGECRERLTSDYQGRQVTLYCNPRLILDFLDAVGNSEVHIGLMDSISPLHFTAAVHDVDIRYILLPLSASRS